jgi:hypothetical protein
MGLKIFSEQFRDGVLKLNLKTPPDIVLGIVELSGASLYTSYLDSLGKDAIIKSDKASVTLKDPGNVVEDSIAIRQRNLNKNLQTPSDIRQGINNTTLNNALTQQYLDGRGLPTEIGDSRIVNPGDVKSESENPRRINLNKNLATPTDIQTYLTTYSLNDRGKETTIRDFSNLDPGNLEESIDFNAEKQRKLLFRRNKDRNDVDPSENDPMFSYLSSNNYTYSSLLEAIGEFTVISDLKIPDANSVTIQSNQTPEISLNLSLQQNRYMPVELNQFESKVLLLQENQSTKPYIDAYNSGVYVFNEPQKYEPSEFLNLNVNNRSPLPFLFGVAADPITYLLNNDPPLKDETLLMNIAALELKFNFEARIKRAIERETLGRTTLDEALTNPITAINLIRDPRSWFEKNFEITVAANPVSRAIEFTSSLAGVQSPISLIRDIREDYTPKCFVSNTTNGVPASSITKFVNDLFGREVNRDIFYLNHTGAGQKYALFSSIKKNKYQPDYLAEYQSGVFRLGDKIAQELRTISGFLGIGAGSRPEGNYYIGNRNKNEDPLYLLQDSSGDQVNSNEELTESLKKANPSGTPYSEPGYDEVSEYGSISTNFIWKKSNNSATTGGTSNLVISTNVDETKYSFNNKTFRECSILFKTSQLLDKGVKNFGSPIDQTLTKFYDGYDFVSRGNATISPVKTPRLNKAGELIGYNYEVPGLDISGKRVDKDVYDKSELCRVWTKERPYSKITDLLRYKELNRKERNSVLDRYGNLNIHPSEINVTTVNSGNNNDNSISRIEAFGEKRARKYMFSLENLAWRDSPQFDDLPSCEKGMNGGRVMWFPPYDIAFTDDTTANWTPHQFLGRPEPIYTYNNSERSGTLSWKIVVDHPSILNLLAQKELARLNDNQVDEILSAFWAGCVDFDVFELARIWDQFTQTDIDYFKSVIAGLDLSNSNQILKDKVEKATINTQPQNTALVEVNNITPQSKINGFNFFFENDVPLDNTKYNKKTSDIYDTGTVEAFDVYFEKYAKLTSGVDSNNAEVVKNAYRNNDINPTWIKYSNTIGSNSAENYFNIPNSDSKWYGFVTQFNDVRKELVSDKYKGFDLNIKLEAYASPLAPDKNSKTYNEQLARRRFQSVTKWLITTVINVVGKVYTESGTEITKQNINTLYSENTNTITVQRDNTIPPFLNTPRDTIRFTLVNSSALTPEETIKSIYKSPKKAGTYNYFEVNAPDQNSTSGTTTYCCFETDKISNEVIAKNLLPNKSAGEIGSIEAKVDRPYKDIVCGALSIVSSYARRVTINVEAINKVKDPQSVVPKNETITIPLPTNDTSVTKREIAQRIINKLITECEYFDLLKNDSPIVYSTIKEKLKYFQPAFHAMTPEGLNSRITFLQQCLRPGDTIKKSGTDTCDASNTAFGKPPVCVLRIGDFYNTKIIIGSLNISYDPLVLDLNPEGIGVQPMIANIQLGFKYIGGSGLRKYVDELQNALSFNYYANADIYDERTFANTNEFERSLINLETSYFDNNLLDLIPIVTSAEKFIPNGFTDDIPYGTLGSIVKKRQPTNAGGVGRTNLLASRQYNTSEVYQKYSVVVDNGKFYTRKDDDPKSVTGNSFNGTIAPITNNKYWDEVKLRNYGELPFYYEFGGSTSITGSTEDKKENSYLSKDYFNWYDIQYRDVFKNLYQTYGEVVTSNFKQNEAISENDILLQLVLNKNYNKRLSEGTLVDYFKEASGSTYPISGTTLATSGDTQLNKYYLFKTFDNEASENNYVEFKDLNKVIKNEYPNLSQLSFTPVKLHLYPQNSLFKIGDGKTLVSQTGIFGENNRLDPGNLTGGKILNPKSAEIAGFYFKDYSHSYENINTILNSLRAEMTTKIKLDLLHFWHFDNTSKATYVNYLTYFDSGYRDIFTDYLKNKFINYSFNFSEKIGESIISIEQNSAKLGTLISGLSTIFDGYDVRGNGTSIETFEVIPNEYKLKTEAKQLFGYDPYASYKTSSLNEHKIISLKDVRDYVYNRENTNADKIKFLSLGNGNYFFKQISKDSEIIKVATGTSFNFNNYLVELDSIKSNIVITGGTTPNFVLGGTGITLNDKFDKNLQSGVTTTITIQPGIGEDTTGTYGEYYPMTYTFEKINYEFFDFTNKALDIMINDSFINKTFDLDINYIDSYEFNTQVTALTGATIGQTINASDLFYNGSKTELKNTRIEYYVLNPLSVSGETTFTAITNINTFIPYEYKITEQLVNSISKIKFLSSPLSVVTNQSIKTTGLIDLLFLGFFDELTSSDKTEILNRIKLIEPRLSITGSTSPKIKEKLIEARYKQIENVLNNIFNAITKYKTEALKLLTPINTEYTKNYNNVLKSVNKIITNTESETELTPQIFVDNLIKGGVDDYTLTIKDTKKIKESVENNYKTFTSLKALFNITTQSEEPETEETTINQ